MQAKAETKTGEFVQSIPWAGCPRPRSVCVCVSPLVVPQAVRPVAVSRPGVVVVVLLVVWPAFAGVLFSFLVAGKRRK